MFRKNGALQPVLIHAGAKGRSGRHHRDKDKEESRDCAHGAMMSPEIVAVKLGTGADTAGAACLRLMR
jgi:hypothetical protein